MSTMKEYLQYKMRYNDSTYVEITSMTSFSQYIIKGYPIYIRVSGDDKCYITSFHPDTYTLGLIAEHWNYWINSGDKFYYKETTVIINDEI